MNLHDVEEYGSKSKGQKELINYLKGETLSRTQAMVAKCYECCNGFVDGRVDCKVTSCPMYGFMQYNPNKKIPTKNFSEKSRQEQSERLKKRHEQV